MHRHRHGHIHEHKGIYKHKRSHKHGHLHYGCFRWYSRLLPTVNDNAVPVIPTIVPIIPPAAAVNANNAAALAQATNSLTPTNVNMQPTSTSHISKHLDKMNVSKNTKLSKRSFEETNAKALSAETRLESATVERATAPVYESTPEPETTTTGTTETSNSATDLETNNFDNETIEESFFSPKPSENDLKEDENFILEFRSGVLTSGSQEVSWSREETNYSGAPLDENGMSTTEETATAATDLERASSTATLNYGDTFSTVTPNLEYTSFTEPASKASLESEESGSSEFTERSNENVSLSNYDWSTTEVPIEELSTLPSVLKEERKGVS